MIRMYICGAKIDKPNEMLQQDIFFRLWFLCAASASADAFSMAEK